MKCNVYMLTGPKIPQYVILGTPSIPWQGWIAVFSSYLHLLEEEQGAQLPDIVRNSLLLGLVGTCSLQQLVESPVITSLATATHIAFVRMVTGHFKCLLSTACSDQGVLDQKSESTGLNMVAQYRSLESDEQSQRINLPLVVESPLLHLFLQWSQSSTVPMATPFLI